MSWIVLETSLTKSVDLDHLFWVNAVCDSNVRQLFAADDSSRRLLFCFIFTAQPISQTTVYTAKEGDALDINCNATSTHNNEIYWEKNVSHSTFRQNGSHLNFVNITRDSTGGYVCYSKNLTAGTVNASIVRSIDINVLCKFCSLTFHLLKTAKPRTLGNSEDPDEMQHNAAFHQGLHCLLYQNDLHGEKSIKIYL